MSTIPENVAMLSHSEKVAIAREIMIAQRDLQSKFEMLGIAPPADDKRKFHDPAPDGGPKSDAHRYLPKHFVDTVRVRSKQTGTEVVINKDVYEQTPELFELVDQEERVQTRLDEYPPEPKVVVSDVPEDELRLCTMSILRALPEYNHVPDDVRESADKSKLVDAILEVRRENETLTN